MSAAFGAASSAEVDAVAAERHFNAGHELHLAGNADASYEALTGAIDHYASALQHMGGAHAATQYYLGTAQLDAGFFAAGVANVAAALAADADNFGPAAVQRLKSGRQSVDMACTARAQCDDTSKHSGAGKRRTAEAAEGQGGGGGRAAGASDDALVTVWDDAISGDLLEAVAAAGADIPIIINKFMYMYMYMYIIYIYVQICIDMYIDMYVYINVCVYICIYVYIYIYIYIMYMCVYIYLYK